MGKMISGLFGNNGQADADKAQARAAASAAAAEKASQEMKANFATDLTNENQGTVIAGGTADSATTNSANDLLKKKKAGGLSSQLGLNV